MPTRTELIPCTTCGKPRPVVVRKPADITRALTQRCKTCATPEKFKPYTTEVPCLQCEQPRPIRVTKRGDLTSAQTRICADCRNKNHAPPPPVVFNVDEMAVARLLAGQPVRANPAERREAVAYLTRRQVSARVIAERIGCTQRTVTRHRAKIAS